MPIVSEHPRSINIIRALSAKGDSELGSWVAEYGERRRSYEQSSMSRRTLVEELEYEGRDELPCRELIALLDAREAAVERLRDELDTMNKELVLLKREVRRARRKLFDGTGLQEPEPERTPDVVSTPAAARRDAYATQPGEFDSGLPQLMNLQEILDASRNGRAWEWLKPWLRGFLPSSA